MKTWHNNWTSHLLFDFTKLKPSFPVPMILTALCAQWPSKCQSSYLINRLLKFSHFILYYILIKFQFLRHNLFSNCYWVYKFNYFSLMNTIHYCFIINIKYWLLSFIFILILQILTNQIHIIYIFKQLL